MVRYFLKTMLKYKLREQGEKEGKGSHEQKSSELEYGGGRDELDFFIA